MNINVQEMCDEKKDYLEHWIENKCVGCSENYNEIGNSVVSVCVSFMGDVYGLE